MQFRNFKNVWFNRHALTLLTIDTCENYKDTITWKQKLLVIILNFFYSI